MRPLKNYASLRGEGSHDRGMPQVREVFRRAFHVCTKGRNKTLAVLSVSRLPSGKNTERYAGQSCEKMNKAIADHGAGVDMCWE